MIGCGDDPPPTIDGTGNRNPTGTIGGTGGASGAGGAGGGSGAGGAAPKGACDNGSDLDAIEGASSGLRDIARDCGLIDCAANVGDSIFYEDCVSNCVANDVTGLSANCAGCYADLERRGLVADCRFECQINSCGTRCLTCLNDANCITDFGNCRGLSGDGCPG